MWQSADFPEIFPLRGVTSEKKEEKRFCSPLARIRGRKQQSIILLDGADARDVCDIPFVISDLGANLSYFAQLVCRVLLCFLLVPLLDGCGRCPPSLVHSFSLGQRTVSDLNAGSLVRFCSLAVLTPSPGISGPANFLTVYVRGDLVS